jgi:hypothetical protein
MKYTINTDKSLTPSVRIEGWRQTDGRLKLIKQGV